MPLIKQLMQLFFPSIKQQSGRERGYWLLGSNAIMKKLTVALERCLPIARQKENILPSVNRLLYLLVEEEELGMAAFSQLGWLPQSWVQLERPHLGWFSIFLIHVSRSFWLAWSLAFINWACYKTRTETCMHSSLTEHSLLKLNILGGIWLICTRRRPIEISELGQIAPFTL